MTEPVTTGSTAPGEDDQNKQHGSGQPRRERPDDDQPDMAFAG
jgi:hypothetical protein